jgi:hypothetical protein
MTEASKPRWRKSSYSGAGAEDCVEVAAIQPGWLKSSHSGGGGEDCVEVASVATRMVAVRDSKNPNGPRLHFTKAQWATLVSEVKGMPPAGLIPD